MYAVRYGGRHGQRVLFAVSNDMLVVRSRRGPSLARAVRTRAVANALRSGERVAHFPSAGVEVLRVRTRRGRREERDRLRRALRAQKGIEFAGRVLRDRRSGRPVVYTENLFVQLDGQMAARKARKLLAQQGLEVKRALKLGKNAYFVAAKAGIGLDVFALSERLLKLPAVQLCHPELIRPVSYRRAYPQQWHLHRTSVNGRVVSSHANVEKAWRLSRGRGVTIAVIDDGVDIDHREFKLKSKIVSPRDVTRRRNDARPYYSDDNHGTACAGVACARGRYGASGVAPDAKLLPIRLMSGLGSQAEADAFVWAVDHGADVISCSWGPEDGDWEDPDDPLHDQVTPLPDHMREAIDYAIEKGRGGLGCVITWAAGNGGESVDNDGYASYERVIAVAACNDRGKRSKYSDFGDAIWCSFPSDDFGPPDPRTPGIWTTDRSGMLGYNPNWGGGDAKGNYTEDFGGTSSACPGAAGVAALVLARNPKLRWDEVRDLLARSCGKIDRRRGRYKKGRSPFYGHGRLNARAAVERADRARSK